MPSRRFKLVVAVMCVLTVGTYLLEPYVGAHSFAERRPAEPFSLATIDGTTFAVVAGGNGKAVVLDFMATWCPPCREEVRQLALLRGRFLPSQVEFLTVDVDFTENATQLREWRQAFVPSPYNASPEAAGWSFAMDTPGAYVGPKYGANALPTLVVIDPQGSVRHTWVGFVTAGRLEDAVASALAPAA